MEVNKREWQGGESYLGEYDVLMGDVRTQRTFRGVIEGIIAGEELLAADAQRLFVVADGSPNLPQVHVRYPQVAQDGPPVGSVPGST